MGYFEMSTEPSVHDAKTLINPLNKAINYAHKEEMILIFTRDWHPSNHWSFKENNGPWSKHCVQNTPGAEFHKDLIIPPDSLIVDIGAEPKIKGYSPYENPLMNALINRSDIKNVYVVGIALEYCVLATCLDTIKRNKKTIVIESLVRSPITDTNELLKIWNKYCENNIEKTTYFINS